MSVIKILDHNQQAKDRLLEQYKGSVTMQGFVDALVNQVQELEGVYCDLEDKRLNIDLAEGVQLDLIGDLVGQPREGRTDPEYRIRLKARIIQNIAEGEPEVIIQVVKLISGATLVHLQDAGLGGFLIGINLTTLPEPAREELYQNTQLVAGAGIRLDWIYCSDPVDPFAFAGGLLGFGFSSTGAPLTGGKFAFLHPRNFPEFAFAGDSDPNAGGFSTLLDPLVGGIFLP